MPFIDQGNTYNCGPTSTREWFAAFGYTFDWQAVWAAVKGRPYTDPGEGFTFPALQSYIRLAGARVGVALQGLRMVDAVPDLEAAITAQECVIAGLYEGDVVAGQNFYHFIAVVGEQGDKVTVVDPFRIYDGAGSSIPRTTFIEALQDNWDPNVSAICWRFA